MYISAREAFLDGLVMRKGMGKNDSALEHVPNGDKFPAVPALRRIS